jgi:hypothetical protein
MLRILLAVLSLNFSFDGYSSSKSDFEKVYSYFSAIEDSLETLDSAVGLSGLNCIGVWRSKSATGKGGTRYWSRFESLEDVLQRIESFNYNNQNWVNKKWRDCSGNYEVIFKSNLAPKGFSRAKSYEKYYFLCTSNDVEAFRHF